MKIRNSTVAALIVLVVFCSQDSFAAIDRDKSRTFYEEGLQFYRDDSLSEAVIQLRNALQNDGDNLAARILLGEALLRDGQPEAAIKELELALSMGGDENLIFIPLAEAYLDILKPGQVITGITPRGHQPQVDAELHRLQAEAYLILKNTKLADDAYISAMALNPSDIRPLLGRARIALGKRDRKAANKFIAEATGLDPNSFDLWMFTSLLHRDDGDYKRALEAFEQALRIRPTSGRALTARAALWLDLGNEDAAKADLEKARNLGADTLESIYLRTLLLFREGKAEEAREVLVDSAAEINSIEEDFRSLVPNTRLMLGIVAFFQDNFEEAISHLQTFLGGAPNHRGAKRYLASAFAALGDWDAVIKLYRPTGRSEPPAEPMALSLLAEAYRAKGDYAKAERYYESALEIAPDAAGIAIRLAMTHLNAGKADLALKQLGWFAERFPNFLEVKIQLARVYLKLERIDDALSVAEGLIAQHGDNAQARNTAGTVYLAAGDALAARAHINMASQIDPTYILPKLNLARLERSEGNFASAESGYRLILEEHPNNSAAGIELARSLVKQGLFDEAHERIAAVLKIQTNSFEVDVLLLQILQGQRAPEEEIVNLATDLTKKFPKEPRAEIIAGRIYASLGQLEDARIRFRHAVDKAEFNSDLLVQTAEQQIGIGDRNGALWTLTKALQGTPMHLRAGALKVGVLTALSEFEKATLLLDELFAAHKDEAILLSARGDLRKAQGDLEGALSDYHLAYELAPVRHTLHTLFGALVAQGQLSSAAELMSAWIASNPRDTGSRITLGNAYLAHGDLKKARSVYESLRSDGINNVVVLNNLASVYHQLGDSRALPTAKLAFEMAPKVANVLDTYGWILSEQGNAKEGLSVLREAYARSSALPEIRYHIGVALAKLGKNDEALVELEASLANNDKFPGSEKARALLGDLKRDSALN